MLNHGGLGYYNDSLTPAARYTGQNVRERGSWGPRGHRKHEGYEEYGGHGRHEGYRGYERHEVYGGHGRHEVHSGRGGHEVYAGSQEHSLKKGWPHQLTHDWSTSSGDRKTDNLCQSCSNAISSRLERAFYWVGKKVATYPVIFIVLSTIIAGALGSGIYFLEEEARPPKLWLDPGSDGELHYVLSQRYFPTTYRLERVIVADDSNVLRADVIKAMFELDKNIKALNKGKESSWESVCVRLANKCWSNSLLELWNFDETKVSALTDASLLDDINTITTSPYFGGELAVANLLGGVVRDNDGRIISATSSIMDYYTAINDTEVDGKLVHEEYVLDFEKEYLNLLLKGQDGIETLYFYAIRSYEDVFAVNTNLEARTLLGVGYGLMAVFVVVVIGNLNRLEHRVFLAGGGMLSIGLAILVALGLGTYLGFYYGPLQNVLALLLLGVGVDDMFVITHALDRLPSKVLEEASPIHQVALAMRHAGVSITVTSITDIIVFAVGAFTTLPALRTFCVYCAIGMLAMYLLLITFFVGCLAIDRKRVQQHRDACCCFMIGFYWEPTECSQKSLLSWFFKRFYSRIVTHPATKVIVILIAAGLVSGAGYGVYHMEIETDFSTLFPEGTYPRQYLDFLMKEYPTAGSQTSVYLIDVDYFGEKSTLDQLHIDLDNDYHIRNGTIVSWYSDFIGWLKTSPISNSLLTRPNGEVFPKDEDTFYILLQQFLESEGARHKGSTVKTYLNGANKMRVNGSRINMQHANVHTTTLQIEAVDRLLAITTKTGLGQDHCFPYGHFYPAVAANRGIRQELYRNLGLAFVCVAVVTLPLINSLITCTLVCLSIVITLVDVAGYLYFRGFSIDIVSALTLILTIGLSVDYSTHVGNAFMTVTGTRDERVRATLEKIGSPVFLGGFSTILALSPLIFASSFVLYTFLTIITAIVVVGLFHGLALLPVLLSLVGPAPYASAYKKIHPSESLDSENDYLGKRTTITDLYLGDLERDPSDKSQHHSHYQMHSDHQRKNDLYKHNNYRMNINNRHPYGDPSDIWYKDSSYSGDSKQSGNSKKRLFYFDPRYKRPVPLYNGRPAVRPLPYKDFIGHSVRGSYDERHKSRHFY